MKLSSADRPRHTSPRWPLAQWIVVLRYRVFPVAVMVAYFNACVKYLPSGGSRLMRHSNRLRAGGQRSAKRSGGPSEAIVVRPGLPYNRTLTARNT